MASYNGQQRTPPDFTPEEVQELIRLCHKAKTFAYNVYSNFRVGASLLSTDGRWFTGCNVENASYGLTICAERTALCKAVSEGCKSFKAIAITSDLVEEYCSPCGACRQFIAEFGLDYHVFLVRPDSTYRMMTVSELLPHSFSPKHLEEKRIAPS